MTWTYASAGPGDVALMGEVDAASGVLALAFAADPDGAHTLALESLTAGIDAARTACTTGWQTWAAALTLPAAAPGDPPGLADALRRSAAVIKAHEDHSYPGAFVASLSVGLLGGDQIAEQRAGVVGVSKRQQRQPRLRGIARPHEVVTREVAAALAPRDGHWEQNFFPDGTAFWGGTQLDEAGLPIMLAAKLADEGQPLPAGSDEMVRRALGFLVGAGPLTPQDRWEENPGGSPFTLGVIVSALVAGAGLLARAGSTSPIDLAESTYLVTLADNWNERIESWTYITGSVFDTSYGVAGHYVRIGPPPSGDPNAPWGPRGFVPLQNQPPGTPEVAAALLVGMEFLYLARLGLRAATDQRLLDTIKVVEGELGVNLSSGRAYHRYEHDGYGENCQ